MSNAETTIIEINGVKLEVDLRNARRVDQLKVGSRVKCLVKEYNSWKTYAGVIVGFEPFKDLPTIIVAYLDAGYGSGGLKFKTFNIKTEDFDLVPDLDFNALEVDKVSILKQFDRDIAQKENELQQIKDKKEFFIGHFGLYFKDGSHV